MISYSDATVMFRNIFISCMYKMLYALYLIRVQNLKFAMESSYSRTARAEPDS